ncbi:pseudouridine synthase [Nubsella zeaxanthinifaciens]|uniref:pseudouridine synthase n=1 Tax=Nubsella zeaxanthinifaciens TaxID=392412 RepID=UPI003D058AFB
MTNSNKGKSRDDKSNTGKRSGERGGERGGERSGRRSYSDGDKPKRFNEGNGDRRFDNDKKDFKSNTGRPARNNFNDNQGFKKSFDKKDDRPWEKRERTDRGERSESRERSERSAGRPERNNFDRRDSGGRTERSGRSERNNFDRRESGGERTERNFKKEDSFGNKRGYAKRDGAAKDSSKFSDRSEARYGDNRPFRKREDNFKNTKDKGERVSSNLRSRKNAKEENDDLIRLNRYISNAGVCSRRKADELIEAGVVSVNGVVVTEMGHKVDPYKDEVRYNGELLKRERKVYVLLNKPKDYITTTDDPQERKTVMHLVEKASKERIYPVGRLDRNTTGLLLMTNDGELADRLSHPRNGITKIYQVELSKNLTQGDFNKIQFGLELEDGFIKPDNISYVTGGSKNEIGIQIHSGKNRIVRRIFEHLGYDVVKLDRVVYGNLTKKDLPRGRWRYLDEQELIQIKHLIK